ncbi:mannosyltransferase [Kitasatospora sp. MAP12-15]|uniref:glycosyltransferase family 39 protein n=1 Tax=unclassified Kitasatospora TaxID=2633591 RepID=UPI0024736878|nr:glycosyltransferase family 39 protein [Kitasatospora sp. MAP12-44]MDH6110928.1 mannosyltransferase [Kitasatospora sp. MAP12-44]
MSISAVASDAPAGPDESGERQPLGPLARLRAQGPPRLLRLLRMDWLWVALLTAGIGRYQAGKPELWRDELASWSAATRSTGQLLEMLRHVDAVSGAYYLLLHEWISIAGDSPVMMRIPSVIAMAGASACVVLTARRLFDRRTALLAGLIFATVPSISRYAQEARSYAFVVLAVSAAMLLLLRALERPTWRRWLAYAAAVTASGLFHIVSLLFLAAHALIVLLRWWRDRSRRPLIGFTAAVTVGLIPLIPLVILGRRQVTRQIGWVQKPVLQTFADIWSPLFGSALVCGCVLALAVLPSAWPRGRRRAFEIGLVASLPILLNWFVSQGNTSYFSERYMLFTVPAWSVLAAAGLGALRPRVLGALGLVGMVLLGLPDQGGLRDVNSHEWSDTTAAARILIKGYQPGDGFAPLRSTSAWMMIDYQMEYDMPPAVKLHDVFTAKTPAQAQDLFAVECTDPVACLGDTARVWVVTTGDNPSPVYGFPKNEADALMSAYKAADIEHVRGLTVSLLVRQ